MQNISKNRPKKKSFTPTIQFIVITIFIDTIGLGIFVPIYPKLLQELTNETISNIAIYGGLLTFSYSFMQFIFAPILGALSDRYGRKPLLIISLGALGVDYIFMALAPTLIWLFIARIISGIMGASFTIASAYIADISDDNTRTRNFGLMEAAFGVGFIFGPIIGGVLGNFGTRIPLFFAAFITLCNVIYGIFFVPESIPKKNKDPVLMLRKISPISSIKHFIDNKRIMYFVFIFFIIHLGVSSFHNVWVFFTIEKFNWDARMIGISLGFFGLALTLNQGFLAKPITKKFGNINTLYYGLIITIFIYILIAIANQGWMMFALIFIFELGWLSTTALMSLTAKEVTSIEQGKLQGVLTSMIGLSNIIGPLLMTGLFYLFSAERSFIYFPGAPFAMAGVLALIALIILKKLDLKH